MIDFSDIDIDETKLKKIPIMADLTSFVGRKVIISDDSKYSYQNPLDDNGNKRPGFISESINNAMVHVKWVADNKSIGYYNYYSRDDIILTDL